MSLVRLNSRRVRLVPVLVLRVLVPVLRVLVPVLRVLVPVLRVLVLVLRVLVPVLLVLVQRVQLELGLYNHGCSSIMIFNNLAALEPLVPPVVPTVLPELALRSKPMVFPAELRLLTHQQPATPWVLTSSKFPNRTR
jgi:hypothetical protein